MDLKINSAAYRPNNYFGFKPKHDNDGTATTSEKSTSGKLYNVKCCSYLKKL